VHKVCRYYFALLPILQDRPNVMPWFTNYDDDSSNDSMTIKSSIDKFTYHFNSSSDSDSDLGGTEVRVMKVKRGNKNKKNKESAVTTTEYSSSSLGTILNRSITDTDTSNELDNTKRRTTTVNKGKEDCKLSHIIAKQFKKNLFKDKSRQINSKKK
jgi:hypothetical protein